jgi:hypothetical protein
MALKDIATFTRSTIASYVGPDGLIRWAPANAPRITHDPLTGARLGLLFEESAANYQPYSADFTQANWVKAGCTVSEAGTTPWGTAAQLWTEDTTTGQKRLYYGAVPVPSGTVFTCSIFVNKKDAKAFAVYPNIDGQGSFVSYDLDTLEKNAESVNVGTATHTSGIIDYGGGGVRIWNTTTFPSPVTSINVYLYFSRTNNDGNESYTGDGTSGVYVAGAQLEAGGPTSYIPTEGTSVARGADALTFPAGQSLRADQGTLFVDATLSGVNIPGQGKGLAVLSDGTSKNDVALRLTSGMGLRGRIRRDGTELQNYIYPDDAAGRVKAAITYGPAVRMAYNGTLNAGAYTDMAPLAVSQLEIGLTRNASGVAAEFAQGEIFHDIRYYPRALTAAELVALTS